MTALVVDTNVPIVANGRAPQAGLTCVLACIDALDDLRLHHTIVLDNLGLILDEYRNNLSARGQPGVGDAFFKWVWQNQATRHAAKWWRFALGDTEKTTRSFPPIRNWHALTAQIVNSWPWRLLANSIPEF